MNDSSNNSPFSELPAALVQEMLGRTQEISEALLGTFNNVKEKKAAWRSQLLDQGVIQKDSSLPLVPIPTSCGIDGGLAIERLLAIDLVAIGAVAVEGLTPPSDARYWPEPRHLVYVDIEAHDADTSSILRAIMAGKELELAQHAPHDLVFLDGSLTTPTIFFNQALNKVLETPSLRVTAHLKQNIKGYLESYKNVLLASRSDRYWIALPKYTTRREIGLKMQWPEVYDDRGLLSTLLEAGEYTQPTTLMSPEQPWHINSRAVKEENLKELADQVTNLLNSIQVVYYRPYTWLPALRIEFAESIAVNSARLSTVLIGIKQQCGSAAIMEPYPLYMADRMVKHLAKSIPAFRQIASQNLAENYTGDIGEVFMSLHGYRTESGG